MKRKILMAAMAICLSGVSALSVVGCNEKESKKEVSSGEFAVALVDSYRNYAKAHSDYENSADIVWSGSSYEKDEMTFEWTYTPEGETESQVQSCVESWENYQTATFELKKIDEEIFLHSETVSEHVEQVYEYVDDYSPYEKTTTREKYTYSFTLGVHNGTYYLKAAYSEEYFKDDGSSEVAVDDKEYMTFDTIEDYQYLLEGAIDEFNQIYLEEFYSYYNEYEESFSFIEQYSKFYQDGDLFTAKVDLDVVNFDDKTPVENEIKIDFTVGANGPVSLSRFTAYDFGGEYQQEKKFECTMAYKSKLQAETNPFDGYTLSEDIDFWWYFVDITYNSGK